MSTEKKIIAFETLVQFIVGIPVHLTYDEIKELDIDVIKERDYSTSRRYYGSILKDKCCKILFEE